ncbi:hypothetical protein B484DRAFT_482513 [Ochromonadaceae sp. CCMP2298]|nr:hypothetical protein B484DRAFT_482513 [Ochromonadaceae sp. CCMP2298]
MRIGLVRPTSGGLGSKRRPRGTAIFAVNNEDVNEDGFTQKQLLKEETEAPFRTVRIYLYIALLAAAGLGSLISLTKLLAMNGRGEDMTETYTNLAINLGGIPVLGLLWKRDLDGRKSILERIQRGGSLAGLKVKVVVDGEPLIVKLADLRRDRGIDKRVVIVAAEKALLKSSLATSVSQSRNLVQNDLLIVPLAIEKREVKGKMDYTLTASSLQAFFSEEDPPAPEDLQHLALPTVLPSWNAVIKKEFETALQQNPEALDKGITIIIKKNGKVGTRRFGVPIWEGLIGDVASRAERGLDVRNI